MTAGRDVDRIVIVHGPVESHTNQALLTAGLDLAAEIGDTSLWVRRCVIPAVPAGSAVAATNAGELPARLLMSVAEAAAVLGVGRTTAYALIARGDLEVVHIGRVARVPITAVQDLVDRLRQSASPSQGRGILRSLGVPDASQPSAAIDSQPPAAVRSAAS